MLLHIVFYGVVSFLFTRAHGVPFGPLSTPRAHILNASLQGAVAMGAMLPPIPPSISIRHCNFISLKFGTLLYNRYLCR